MNTDSQQQKHEGADAPWDITFSHVTLGYGTTAVLSDLSAVLPGGAISVILGESGSGKSTLLRHLIGLSKPIAGTLTIGGHDFFSLPSADFRRLRRNMGVLFQDGALLGSLKVWENVALPLSEHLRLSRECVRAWALHVLALVELAHAADFYPHELSGGMRKRAGLARAMITNPRLLVCDEPTSGLDPITSARMDDLLLALHGHSPQMTIVVVSHDLASVARIADHVLLLHEGHVAFAGAREELFASTDPYVRQFVLRESASANDTGAFSGDLVRSMDPSLRDALAAWLAQ